MIPLVTKRNQGRDKSAFGLILEGFYFKYICSVEIKLGLSVSQGSYIFLEQGRTYIKMKKR